jgi:hypothetical protein
MLQPQEIATTGTYCTRLAVASDKSQTLLNLCAEDIALHAI